MVLTSRFSNGEGIVEQYKTDKAVRDHIHVKGCDNGLNKNTAFQSLTSKKYVPEKRVFMQTKEDNQ